MKRPVLVPACEPAILSLIWTAVEWCFSLLFHAGSEQPNVLDGKGFQPSQKAHSPCFCENLPANSESRGGHRSELEATAPSRAKPASDAEREPRNGVGFVRDRVDWFFSARASPPEYAAPPSCLGETSDGAPIIRSSPRWFTGNLAAQQHNDAVDAGRSGFTPARSRAASRATILCRSQ
jgi:hypothetical protein